jgi:hypothetical protein
MSAASHVAKPFKLEYTWNSKIKQFKKCLLYEVPTKILMDLMEIDVSKIRTPQ